MALETLEVVTSRLVCALALIGLSACKAPPLPDGHRMIVARDVQSSRVNRLPSPDNAEEARKIAFSAVVRTLAQEGVVVDEASANTFLQSLKNPEDVPLNPIGHGHYGTEARFSGILFSEKAVKYASQGGLKKFSGEDLKRILSGLCPLWPFC